MFVEYEFSFWYVTAVPAKRLEPHFSGSTAAVAAIPPSIATTATDAAETVAVGPCERQPESTGFAFSKHHDGPTHGSSQQLVTAG